MVQLAAARLAVLWAARPPEAAGEREVATWLLHWVRTLVVVPSDDCSTSLQHRERTQLLAQMNGVAARLLRLHQRGLMVVWGDAQRRVPAPVLLTCRALCSMAKSLAVAEACSAQELVLAGEAAGLAAAALQAAMEREAAGGSEPGTTEGLSLSFTGLLGLYEAMGQRCYGWQHAEAQQRAPPDLDSSATGAESLVGAVEAGLRLAAVLARRVLVAAGTQAPGVAVFGAAVNVAAGIIAYVVVQKGKSAAVRRADYREAVQHCAVTAAKLAGVVAALPKEQQAVLGVGSHSMVRSSLLLVMTLLEEPHATSLEDAGGLR